MVDVRIAAPARLAAGIPGVRVVTVESAAKFELLPAAPEEEKVLVWQRPILEWPKNLATLRALVERGYLLIVERDDYPWRPDFAANRHLSHRGVHAIQTSTETLAVALRQWNPNVGVFPNQLTELPPPREHADGGPVTIFFGAFNRQEDWKPCMGPLNDVLRPRGDGVRVRVVHDRAFFDALETPYKEFEPSCPYDRYRAILGQCDVALLPLADTPFNRCKSDLKFLECAGHGVAVLASPTAYAQTVVDGETGLLFRSPEELAAGLRRLLDDAELRRALALRAYEYVGRERLMARYARDRVDWYRSLLERLPELNAELEARVPELFS
jgi:hypothetical protein